MVIAAICDPVSAETSDGESALTCDDVRIEIAAVLRPTTAEADSWVIWSDDNLAACSVVSACTSLAFSDRICEDVKAPTWSAVSDEMIEFIAHPFYLGFVVSQDAPIPSARHFSRVGPA
ncbi:hypothetical protein [Caballeronia grimmiae]|uniref:hypothetical protein n=1 Tax=Caballeronia grimmiae TaxID=1071679 RepID=UPI0038BBBF6C